MINTCRNYNCTVAQIAIAWLFNQDLQIIPLQGEENADMYRQTLDAAKINLTKEEVCWLDLRVE